MADQDLYDKLFKSEDGQGASGEDSTERTDKSDAQTNFLRDFLARSLGLKENPDQKLETLTLEGVAKYILSDQCQNIVTMAGAGISTSAGIPDFRSPGTGLYDNLASYNLPSPQAIFELEFFNENPRPFFVLAKELMPGAFKPTPCHYFIKMLNDSGKLLRHYTQNIDTLERVAGLDPEKLVEAHGTFHTSHCLKCRKEFTFLWMKEQILSDKVPACDVKDCGGVVKPDIVFFGERLPERFVKCVEEDLKKCDLLIVTGTSLTVQPFASLVSRVPFEAPRLYINLEKGMSVTNPISILMFGGGFQFDSEDNYRDVFKEATCDDGCQELADLLGWGDSLKELVKKEHGKIDKASSASSPTKKTTGATDGKDSPKPSPVSKDSPKPSPATKDSTKPSPATKDSTKPKPATKDSPNPSPATKDSTKPSPGGSKSAKNPKTGPASKPASKDSSKQKL